MTAARASRVFVDTNVLLCAIDRKRRLNGQALHVLNAMPNAGTELCVSGQVLRELCAVSSRPVAANGLGLTPSKAVDNARAVLARATLLPETPAVVKRLLDLVRRTECAGKQVHDANVAAMMIEHGIRDLVTDNVAHFARFLEIAIIDLAQLPVHG